MYDKWHPLKMSFHWGFDRCETAATMKIISISPPQVSSCPSFHPQSHTHSHCSTSTSFGHQSPGYYVTLPCGHVCFRVTESFHILQCNGLNLPIHFVLSISFILFFKTCLFWFGCCTGVKRKKNCVKYLPGEGTAHVLALALLPVTGAVL